MLACQFNHIYDLLPQPGLRCMERNEFVNEKGNNYYNY